MDFGAQPPLQPPQQQHRGSVTQSHHEDLSPLKTQQRRREVNEAARKVSRDRLVAAKRVVLDPEHDGGNPAASLADASAGGGHSVNGGGGYDVGVLEIRGLEVALKSTNSQHRILSLVKLRRFLVEPSDATVEFVVAGEAVPILVVRIGSLCSLVNFPK